MFFKRNRKDKPATADDVPGESAVTSDSIDPAPAAVSVAPSNVIPFAADEHGDAKPIVTDKVSATSIPAEIFAQDAALAALKLGLEIRRPGCNITVIGPTGTGRRRAIAEAIARHGAQPVHGDCVYFTACDGSRRVEPMDLPHGRGAIFQKSLSGALRMVDSTLEAIFGTAEFDTTRRIVEEEFRHERMTALDALRRRAEAQNIAMLKTPDGYVLAPMHDGKVVRPEIFQALPQTLQRDVENKIETLERELKRHLEGVPKAEAGRRRKMRELTSSIIANAVRGAFEDVKQQCEDHPALLRQLRRIEQDVCDRFADVIDGTAKDKFAHVVDRYVAGIASTATAKVFNDRALVVDIAGAAGLCGTLSDAVDGMLKFTPGALHRANGGTLVLSLKSLQENDGALAALQRALDTRSIAPVSIAGAGEASPLAFSGKVLLLASKAEYRQLQDRHPGLLRLFPVTVHFATTTKRTPESELAFKQMLTVMAERLPCRPLHAEAVAALLQDAETRAGGQGQLSLIHGDITWLLAEADHYASAAHRDKISLADVTRAMQRREAVASGSPA